MSPQCEDPDQIITKAWYLLPVTLHHVWLVTDRSIAMICTSQLCREGSNSSETEGSNWNHNSDYCKFIYFNHMHFSVFYLLLITVNTLVENISCFPQLIEVGNSDRQAHSIIKFQQEMVDWLLVHIQHAIGICSRMPNVYYSLLLFLLRLVSK